MPIDTVLRRPDYPPSIPLSLPLYTPDNLPNPALLRSPPLHLTAPSSRRHKGRLTHYDTTDVFYSYRVLVSAADEVEGEVGAKEAGRVSVGQGQVGRGLEIAMRRKKRGRRGRRRGEDDGDLSSGDED